MRTGFFLAGLIILPVVAPAQQAGQIVGVVTDTSGSLVQNGSVEAVEAQTGYSRKAVTDQTGHFVLPSLRPAVYDLTVEAAGFRTFVRKGVELLANQSLTLNVSLEIGLVSETVTVNVPVVQVDTSTSTLREVVDRERMVELPLNGRNAASLTTLVPGAVIAPASAIDQGLTKTAPGGLVISSSGSTQNQVSYRLDGGDNVDRYTNINMPFPMPDALMEFSVQTSNYTAEFGGNAGAIVNVVTKSGTNEYHGDAFSFVRNRVFNARNFFAAQRDFLKRNQFGALIGGPVRLPRYDARNRTFFFAGWQETFLRNTTNSNNAFVPNNDELAGNFSTCGPSCSAPIKDPASSAPFPGNQIPVSRFDPAALKLAQGYLPRATGNGLVFYGGLDQQDTHEGILKVDHLIGDRDRLSGHYSINQFEDAAPHDPHNLLTFSSSSLIRSQSIVLNETHTFSPSRLNEFTFTYTRTFSTRTPPGDMPDVADFGVQIPQATPKVIESVAVSSYFTVSANATATFVRNNFEASDTMRYIHGRHSLSFGGLVARERMDIVNQIDQYGMFTFNGSVTGNAMADFLLGRMQTFLQGSGQFQNSRNTFPSWFVQDDVKVSRRVTMNLGLRYEPYWPWHDIRNRVERFRPSDFYAGVRSATYPNAPPGLTFPGDAGFPSSGSTGDYNNVAPRMGFAWDVFGDGKTSLRGGAGVFYDQRRASIYDNTWGTKTPFSTTLQLTQPQGSFSNPYLNLTDPFPAAPPGPASVFPEPVGAFSYSQRETTTETYAWNLTLERNLASNWLARLAYVATRGTHIIRNLQLDPAIYTPGVDSSGKALSTTANTDARRLFAPYFGLINQYSPDGNSPYQSLQASLNKRLSGGFTILATYTFSKVLDDMSVPTVSAAGLLSTNIVQGAAAPTLPWYTPNGSKFDYGPSAYDHSQRAVVSYVWELPWRRTSSALLTKLGQGWQFTGIVQVQTGDALTVLTGRDNSLTGLNQDRGQLTGQPLARPANADPVLEFFNTAAFTQNAIGTFGNIGKGTLRGPTLFNWDMGAFKSATVRDRFTVQFRAELFNALNRANLDDPNITVTSPSFGRILAAQDPRIIQLSLKFLF